MLEIDGHRGYLPGVTISARVGCFAFLGILHQCLVLVTYMDKDIARVGVSAFHNLAKPQPAAQALKPGQLRNMLDVAPA
jgi:hypothetical protein